jgi:dolichol-phosphate mannosyltransferase
MAKINVPMDAGDFRLVDRKVVDALKEVRELHRFMRGLTCWVGFRQCAVEYDRAARLAGETKYPVWKSLRLAFDAITSFSAAPLRWVMGLGAIIAVSGFIKGMDVVIGRIMDPYGFEPGWATVVALILFLAGVQLLCLGLVGQYVSRVFEQVKNRPLYVIRPERKS